MAQLLRLRAMCAVYRNGHDNRGCYNYKDDPDDHHQLVHSYLHQRRSHHNGCAIWEPV